MHFLMEYELSPDYLERRVHFRAEHLRHAWAACDRGELLLGGALADPPDRAILIFQADSPAVPEAFAKADPYVRNGLVASFSVRRWITVAGERAATPLRPESL